LINIELYHFDFVNIQADLTLKSNQYGQTKIEEPRRKPRGFNISCCLVLFLHLKSIIPNRQGLFEH